MAAFFESTVGSATPLPPWAAEVRVPRRLLERARLNGVCLRPDKCAIDLGPDIAPAVVAEISRRVAVARSASGNAPTLVAVVPELVPFSANHVPLRPFAPSVALRSISNHERTHANTLTRSSAWHSTAIDVLATCDRFAVQDLWDVTRNSAFFSSSQRAPTTRFEWTAPEEIIAMTNSAMRAPNVARSWVEKMQTAADAALAAMVDEISSRWRTVETLVGWLDGIEAHRDADRLRRSEIATRDD